MKNYHDTYRLRIQNEQHFHEVLRKANHKEHTYAGPGFYFVTEWVEECPACGPRSFIELLHHASLRQEMARLQDQYAALQYNLKMLNKIPECYA